MPRRNVSSAVQVHSPRRVTLQNLAQIPHQGRTVRVPSRLQLFNWHSMLLHQQQQQFRDAIAIPSLRSKRMGIKLLIFFWLDEWERRKKKANQKKLVLIIWQWRADNAATQKSFPSISHKTKSERFSHFSFRLAMSLCSNTNCTFQSWAKSKVEETENDGSQKLLQATLKKNK
jgi:hypothetical protein